MTQEEKAKAYDEAIEKLRSLHDNYDPVSTLIDIKEELEHIFPELTESDKKIKKEITELVMQPTWKTEKEFHRRKELCDWLEKQGQKPAWSEEDEEMYQNIHECLKNGWRKLPTDLLKYESWIKSIKQRR
jgi:hypothetical protein